MIKKLTLHKVIAVLFILFSIVGLLSTLASPSETDVLDKYINSFCLIVGILALILPFKWLIILEASVMYVVGSVILTTNPVDSSTGELFIMAGYFLIVHTYKSKNMYFPQLFFPTVAGILLVKGYAHSSLILESISYVIISVTLIFVIIMILSSKISKLFGLSQYYKSLSKSENDLVTIGKQIKSVSTSLEPINQLPIHLENAIELLDQNQTVQVKQLLNKILDNSIHNTKKLNAMTQIMTTTYVNNMEEIEVDTYIENLVSLFYGDKAIELDLNCNGSIEIGPLDFRLLIDPILTNACEFASKEVLIRTQCLGEAIEIIIKDDGPGIPGVIEGMVDNSIFRSGKSTKEGGTGWGVASAIDLAKNYNAKIQYTTHPNHGTICTITFQQEPALTINSRL